MNANPVEHVGVIGAGTMGVGIAYVFAEAGCQVSIVEPDQTRAGTARTTIAARADKLMSQGRLTAEQAERVKLGVSVAGSIQALPAHLGLIIEAVPEDLDLKRSVLAEAETREPGVLATNTSALSIAQLGTSLREPGQLVGLHFFNPVWSMPLLEIVRSPANADALIETAQHIGTFIGKDTIVVRDYPGFATSRLGVALGLEAIRMLEDGVASAADIDQAMVLGYRHPMGPLRLTDLVGLDVRLHIARQLAESLGPRFSPPQLLVDKVASGQLGKKSGAGFFEWNTP
ncbi:Putative 3-hydroxyacyl-CoA dehydrogenase [Mycobacteroides abscessus subsp. bolletii]|uniref:3-hydroxyacyl-CoA dehydrogenase family protein n=1 Tax=Mycobacteroides abscessus TaxID=36809 RepID=UPI0009A694EC|nr:3-hydroxyacyl-CoA dehydrogenase family protein [Mycobacteroides abscessus]SKG71178.1 Putative 3-hydroxyacyl-CoA dehydrogenase [Mycobacteroides abscessus subsp. bolletii]SKH11361.1 Putative 3-hydroxyacyl-CoA dehydrogenase [Mycobacteroides abscessus subsp. bolletii]